MPPPNNGSKQPTEFQKRHALEQENADLQRQLNDTKEKLSTLRKAKSAEARVVKGATIHVKIPGISKVCVQDYPLGEV